MNLRVLVGAAASAAALLPLACGPEPATDTRYGRKSAHQHELDVSTDGRYHKCGLVTDDGVTEYINAYIARCGDETLAGDPTR